LKRVLLWIAALVAFSSSSFAQNLAGAWQGTLQSSQARGGQFRVVIKVSTTPSDGLSAVMYNIDQGGRSVIANTVSLQGSAVRISLIPIGVTYEGTLSADGNTITGTWDGAPSQPLTFTRATPATAWTIPEPPPPTKAMAPDADPTFEVATVKPSPFDAKGTGISIDPGGRMTIRNKSLANLITFAYKIHSRQLKGLPEGLGSERFDIEAKFDTPGQPNDKQVRSMLRKLIADRFMLAAHQEKKEMSIYAITAAKSGSKLIKTQFSGSLPSERGMNKTALSNTTITDLADFLQGFVLDRPVVDQSGIEGRYDFTLNWTPDETQFGDYRGVLVTSSNDPNAETFPDLFTAMQQQLGLKLESTKAPVDILVIDHVEKPSEN
jgi:uncharacterized protein (TIGR03435 family)